MVSLLTSFFLKKTGPILSLFNIFAKSFLLQSVFTWFFLQYFLLFVLSSMVSLFTFFFLKKKQDQFFRCSIFLPNLSFYNQFLLDSFFNIFFYLFFPRWFLCSLPSFLKKLGPILLLFNIFAKSFLLQSVFTWFFLQYFLLFVFSSMVSLVTSFFLKKPRTNSFVVQYFCQIFPFYHQFFTRFFLQYFSSICSFLLFAFCSLFLQYFFYSIL